ncbi:hypothetical protein M514_11272, partial [Trichuris suis]
MQSFTGKVRVKVVEASDLKPTEWSTRFAALAGSGGRTVPFIDPYVNVDIDEYLICRTSAKTKSNNPRWDETITANANQSTSLGLTVFHDCAIPPDDFVANCRVNFEDLQLGQNDLWVRQQSVHVAGRLR